MTERPEWRRRWARLISVLPDPFVEIDEVGMVTEWNPRAEEVFGWRREEVVGRSISDTVLPRGVDGSLFGGSIPDEDPTMVGETALPAERLPVELMHRAGHRIVSDGLVFDSGAGHDGPVRGFILVPVSQPTPGAMTNARP